MIWKIFATIVLSPIVLVAVGVTEGFKAWLEYVYELWKRP